MNKAWFRLTEKAYRLKCVGTLYRPPESQPRQLSTLVLFFTETMLVNKYV